MDGHLQDSYPPFPHGPPPHNASFHPAIDPNLQPLNNANAFSPHFQLENGHPQPLPLGRFSPSPGKATPLRFQDVQAQHLPVVQAQEQNMQNARFGILGSAAQLPGTPFPQQPTLQNLHHENGFIGDATGNSPEKKESSRFQGMKKIPNPPDLEKWREKLFHVDKIIRLTEEEFQTYFPHVDNFYSHRSTQKHKKQPFVTHYWECRLKGRPAGTPKSTDPNKKKRKRVARQRDLCNFRIKITEYSPGANQLLGSEQQSIEENGEDFFFGAGDSFDGTNQPIGMIHPVTGLQSNLPGADGKKWYKIQRISDPAKEDGIPPVHKHTLEESDRVKKNSILLQIAKEEKGRKKNQKTYSRKATGAASATVKRRSKENDLKLFGSCFCPFVQRVWIALELKGVDYQYYEVDPYEKPKILTDISPNSLIPAIRHGNWSCHESTVLLEYIEDILPTPSLNPGTPQQRAHTRLWADHVNRHIIPSFYRLLQAQEIEKQVTATTELKTNVQTLVDAAHPEGPFFLGPDISAVDVHFAPYILRFRRVLSPYRGWPAPEEGSRWKKWCDAIELNESVKATVSGDEVYIESYERYAENRPGTSQVADAVNTGRGLP